MSRIGHSRRPPRPPDHGGLADRGPDPSAHIRAEDQQHEHEREARHHAEDQGERDQPLLQEPTRLLQVVGGVQRPHDRLHGSGERPEREQAPDGDHDDPAALHLGGAGEALSEQVDGALRHDGREVVEDRGHRIRAGEDAEGADRDQQRRRDRQERVVRDRGGVVRDVACERRADSAIHDAEVGTRPQAGMLVRGGAVSAHHRYRYARARPARTLENSWGSRRRGRQAHGRLLGQQWCGRNRDQAARRPVEVEGDEDEGADEDRRGEDGEDAGAPSEQ